MKYKVNAIRIILAVIFVNAVGFALKYFELNTFLILLGFRFHLSAVLPLLVVMKLEHLELVKESLLHPQYKNLFRLLSIILVMTILSFTALYITGKLEIGDPEYFYEFGLSSIADFPVYLIWNSFQLFFLYQFLVIINKNFVSGFIPTFLVALSIFIYEFIPLNKFIFDFEGISSFVLLALTAAVVIKYFKNVYLFVILFFSIKWSSILAFGTSSSILVNIFLAARYDQWEGFFTIDKDISHFAQPVYFLLVLIVMSIIALMTGRKAIKQNNKSRILLF